MQSVDLNLRLETQLIQSAIDGMNNALTPNQSLNDYRFGAAVLTKDGNIYSAGNISQTPIH